MRRLTLVVAMAAVLVGSASSVLAGFKLDPKEYFPVSQVRPGMVGYGLTVFRGVKIEKFQVRVISVMPQQNSGRPLILVMMSGGPITDRHANIIAGMSGSPVYINGRLLGAVAYGDSGPKEPVGMITPIEDMVDSLDPMLPAKPSFPFTAPAGGVDGTYAELPAMSSARLLPVFASGFGARSLGRLNEWLKPYGITAMSGPGAGGGGGEAPGYFPKGASLAPGGAIAVSLMQGDVDVTAIGTVTYRRGDKILAFGHPFLQIGPTEYPASTAYIHDVFSSTTRSYKMGSPIKTVATIQQDQPFAVGGLVHRLPHMIPLTVHVTDRNTGRRHDFHMQMVNHPVLTPGLVVSGTQEVVDRLRAFPGDAMATVKMTVYPEGMPPITRTNTVFDPGSIGTASTGDVLEAMALLSRNPFQPILIKKVDIAVDIHNGHNTANVERAWIEKDKVEPGETITIQAVIKPYMGRPETRTLKVKIPENSPNGQAQVVVFGGQTGYGRIAIGSPAGGGVTASASVANVKQLMAKFVERERNDDLGVRVLMPGTVVTVDGQRLSGLPDSIADVMKSTKSSSTRLERDELRLTERVPYVLSGQQMLVVNIERKNAVEKSGAASTTTSTTTSATVSSDSSDDSSDTGVAAYASDLQPALAAFGLGGLARYAETQKPPAKDAPKPTEPKPAADKPGNAKPADAKPADAKPADAKPDEADADKDGKGPGRLASMWKQATKTQFETGDLTGVSVSSTGDVLLTPKLVAVADVKRPYIWSVLPMGDGSTLVGTGHGGEILRVAADGKTTVYADTDELEIQSLAHEALGRVYAGTSPNGRILVVRPDGTTLPYFETGERFVFAMATAADGTLYAATGPHGKIFVIAPGAKGRELCTLPETNVVSLALAADGSLLAGTSPDGLVYRVTPKGDATVVYDAPEANVNAVASDAAGNVYAATSPAGKVYRILPNGRAETLLDKPDNTVLSLVAQPDGVVYAAGGKKLYRIAPDKTVTSMDNDDQNQLVALAMAPDGTLRAGSANTGVLYRVETAKTGTYLSPVHDADPRAVWGRLEWQADVPQGASLAVETRTGGVSQPDKTWSAWSAPITSAMGAPITSPAARFVQYRATFRAAADGGSPILHWLSMRYLTDNRPPTVKFTDPKEADLWSGKKTVKWTGADPDSDQLNYTLYASSDDGATWKTLNTAAEAKDTAVKPAPKDVPTAPAADDPASKAKKEARDAETMKQVDAELEKYPDLSPDMKTAVQQTSASALKASAKDVIPEEKAANDNLTKSSYSWDTASMPDGVYKLKVVATDKASNPATPLSAEDVSMGLRVVNAKPKVTITEKDTKIGADLTVALSGDARTVLADIVRVSYRVDKGTWMSAIAADGIFDSPSEGWKIVTDALTKGDHTIEVKATDEADNFASATTKVTIP